ncbi:MAG: transglycosylase SLT domain-containing protein [Treponema sp.]|jgi:membrane-bound lytic murein transglycosylase D|nr:transglycosylase SLT domain-containing protein [Treponema sp.]
MTQGRNAVKKSIGGLKIVCWWILCVPGLLLAPASSADDGGRPLRSVQTPQEDHPAERGELPAFYADAAPRLLSIAGPEVLDEPLVRSYLSRYLTPTGLSWLKATRTRGAPFIPFIKKQIAARGLPYELVFLPAVESEFVVSAKSKSGAAGLWQFMQNSIGPFNIQIDSWVDERFDFWKATEGALAKLQDNYRILGDWPLALAAYNAGLGGVQRLIRQTGEHDYWALCARRQFKTEAVHYVPKFIAISYILSNPRRFGLDLLWESDPAWTRLPVSRQVDLGRLAKVSGVDYALLKKANQELRYGITPPRKTYLLKVPAAAAESIRQSMDRANMPVRMHIVQQGETLWGIARSYGLTPEALAEANSIPLNGILSIGKVLKVPVR